MKTRYTVGSARTKEESIDGTNLSLAATTLIKSALLSGALLAYTAMDIPHNTTWEIK